MVLRCVDEPRNLWSVGLGSLLCLVVLCAYLGTLCVPWHPVRTSVRRTFLYTCTYLGTLYTPWYPVCTSVPCMYVPQHLYGSWHLCVPPYPIRTYVPVCISVPIRTSTPCVYLGICSYLGTLYVHRHPLCITVPCTYLGTLCVRTSVQCVHVGTLRESTVYLPLYLYVSRYSVCTCLGTVCVPGHLCVPRIVSL